MTKVEKFDLKSRQVDIFFITLDSSGNIFNVYLYIIVFVYYHLYIIYIIIILPLRVKCNASAQNGEIRYTKDRILPRVIWTYVTSMILLLLHLLATSITTSTLLTTIATLVMTAWCGLIPPIYYTQLRNSIEYNGTRKLYQDLGP